MRISKIAAVSGLTALGAGLVFVHAYAFDGTRSPNTPIAPSAAALGGSTALAPVQPLRAPALTPMEAFRTGAHALKVGENAKALNSLQYAADKGHAIAQWKLGRMYALGDGVQQNDLRAFQYFSRVADGHADDSPELPQARFVANAFVQLGRYYLEGIPNTDVKADPERAREMFSYAASYFGDADAQYNLARLYLDGTGAPLDARQALRWLGLAANKGQYRAQALLGQLLCSGEHVTRQRARGLMWLTLARDSAGANDKRIAEMHAAAFQQANDDERAMALVYLERWLKTRRE
ncbi:MAG: sel1 repeat family protein [Rhizobiales bacterium]|nr:sel1 repeat family protein [Hyphomicrobiales bacterium]